MALAGGKVHGVNDADVVKLLGGQAGILVAGGEAGTQADVNDAVAGALEGFKEVDVVADAAGRGGAQGAAGCHMGEDLCGGDGHAVFEGFVVFDDGQRGQGNVVSIQKRLGQVTGAVCGDFDIHVWYSLLFLVGDGIRAHHKAAGL